MNPPFRDICFRGSYSIGQKNESPIFPNQTGDKNVEMTQHREFLAAEALLALRQQWRNGKDHETPTPSKRSRTYSSGHSESYTDSSDSVMNMCPFCGKNYRFLRRHLTNKDRLCKHLRSNQQAKDAAKVWLNRHFSPRGAGAVATPGPSHLSDPTLLSLNDTQMSATAEQDYL